MNRWERFSGHLLTGLLSVCFFGVGVTAFGQPIANPPQAATSEFVTLSMVAETADFSVITERVKAEIEVHGADQVLVVVDIDNTTLAMNQSLGSDQWYNWQYNFIFNEIQSTDRVARNLDELLRFQGILFALGKMHPPEPQLPDHIRQIQHWGCCTIVLTSRGPEFRNASERELTQNGYEFSESALEIFEPIRGSFLPYDKTQPDVDGLSAAELKTLRDPRPVSYANGVFMTAGQHKGYMLRTLLARTDRSFKAIVFADDHEKHTTRMTDAFQDTGITTACFRYSREDAEVQAFDECKKSAVSESWKRLQSVLNETFSDTRETSAPTPSHP